MVWPKKIAVTDGQYGALKRYAIITPVYPPKPGSESAMSMNNNRTPIWLKRAECFWCSLEIVFS